MENRPSGTDPLSEMRPTIVPVQGFTPLPRVLLSEANNVDKSETSSYLASYSDPSCLTLGLGNKLTRVTRK